MSWKDIYSTKNLYTPDAAKRGNLLQCPLKRPLGWDLVQRSGLTQTVRDFVGLDLLRNLNLAGETIIKRIEPRHALARCQANYFSLTHMLCLSQTASHLKEGDLSTTGSEPRTITASTNPLHFGAHP